MFNLLIRKLTEMLVVTYSVTYLFAPNFPISRKSLEEGRKQTARQLQSVMLYKQTQEVLGSLLYAKMFIFIW